MTPARTTTDLTLHAEDMGARVVWALDLPERGRTYPHVGVIVIRHGMTERRTVSTLGHELAHYYYGDTLCTPAANRRAWRWAARLLIPDADYAHAEQQHHSPGAIAQHLGVVVDVIHAYQESHEVRSPRLLEHRRGTRLLPEARPPGTPARAGSE